MAHWKTFRCNNCDYTVLMSGKPDALFAGYTTPVVCLKCKSIYDRVTDPIGFDDEEQGCSTCGYGDFKDWDYKRKKCPKCQSGTLDIDPDGEQVMAD